MAEIFKFFNSAPGDERWHYASDFADYFGDVLSSGLIHKDNVPGMQVTVVANSLKTKVAPGQGLIKGYSYQNTTSLELTHDITEVGLNRIDRIVLRLDLRNANRYIKLFVKKGTEAVEPVAPELQRDNYIYELSLAQVKVTSNSTIISPLSLIDERMYEDLCGVVYSLISVPTSVFQQQFDVWFNAQKEVYVEEMLLWINEQKELYEQNVNQWTTDKKAIFDAWLDEQANEYDDFQKQQQALFNTWFTSIQNVLSGDVVGNILDLIDKHESTLASKDNFGHVKIGENIQVKDGIISVEKVDLSELEIKNSQLIREVAGLKLHQEASERIENGIILADDFTATPINLVIDTAASTNLVSEGLSFLKKSTEYLNAYEYFTQGTKTNAFGDVKITSNSINVRITYAWDARSNAIDLTNIKEIRAYVNSFESLCIGCLAVHTDSNVSWMNSVRKTGISLGWVILDVSDLVGIHYFGFSSYYENTNLTQTFNAGNIILVPLDDQDANFFYEAPSTDEICLFLKPTGNISLEVYANEVQCKKEKVDEEFLFSAEIPKLETTNIKIAMHSPDGNTTGKVTRILGGINK